LDISHESWSLLKHMRLSFSSSCSFEILAKIELVNFSCGFWCVVSCDAEWSVKSNRFVSSI
jgi:hypothetical protein